MFLAEEAAVTATKFHTFDIFMIVITVLLVVATLRLLTAPVKNKFAIGFTGFSLLVFLLLDIFMIQNWVG